jgi:hypothetical protein
VGVEVPGASFPLFGAGRRGVGRGVGRTVRAVARRPNPRTDHVPAVETGVGTAEVVADRQRPDGWTLLIDGHVHGHVDLRDPTRLQLDYQARLLQIVLALLPPAPRGTSADRASVDHVPAESAPVVVHLGGGAFAVPRALRVARPDVGQLVVERSASIIKLAERSLGLRRGSDLVVRKGDARAVLSRMGDASADVVAGDAFVDGRTPRHLATTEFMAEVRRVLRPGGAYVVNLIDEQPWTVLGVQAATAQGVFDDVLAIGSRGVARLRDPGNVFLVSAARPLDRAGIRSALVGGAHPCALVPAGQLDALGRQHRPRHDADG